MYQSIATIDSPEFLNLKPLDINPLMSSCEIKVLYLGDNRNKTNITKDVAMKMAKTLRGAPIVGHFKEDTQDFGEHDNRVTIENGQVKFECLTQPYGFVDPAARVWFQKFIDIDNNGNQIEREYLMTTGYLWTGQYEECKCAVEGDGRNHSMELDKKTLDGHWTQNFNKSVELFIINDAIFSKLCILGENEEPCFEGSSIKAPEVSSSFSLDDGFRNTLYNMMQELKLALEGGQQMTDLENKENFSLDPDKDNQTVELENQNNTEDNSSQTSFAASSNDDEKKEEGEENYSKEPTSEENKEEEDKKSDFSKDDTEDEDKEEKEDNDKKDNKEDVDDEKKANFALIETELSELKVKYSALEEEYNKLLSFKNQIENEKKDALIQSFYMLSDEDKADVIANKTEYSLDDIEAKLSVICVRKKVNFSLDEEEKETKADNTDPITTFSLDGASSNIPEWIKAVKRTAQDRH